MKAFAVALPFFVLIAIPTLASAADEDGSLATADLAEIDRKLNNPLTSIWSLTFQNNTSANTGDSVSGTEYSNSLFFQPFMPFEVGANKQTMFTLRPVFPMVTQPQIDFSSGESSSHKTGYGDTQLLVLAGPNTGEGFVWGAGASFIFPTASDDVLGQGKYQAGPAFMVFNIGKPWVYGVLAQQQISSIRFATRFPMRCRLVWGQRSLTTGRRILTMHSRSPSVSGLPRQPDGEGHP
jgi:hypothetical protein